MMKSVVHSLCASSLFSFVLAASASAQLTVVALDPPITSSNRAPNSTIVVDFDRALDPASLSHFTVYGSSTGTVAGALTLENGNTRIRFAPMRPFFAGEIVTIGMSNQLKAQDGSFLRSAGYVSSFRVRAGAAPMTFTTLTSFFTDPGNFTRIYGGQVCDLDGDDYTDLAVISENSSDVRVFKNTADASGTFVTPNFSITAVGTQPSPNENADFNGDGKTDIVTCNGAASTFSILIGNGDGTFQPAVSYSVGSGPHGLAVLDCDGDGDIDVVTANVGSSNLTLRKNLGNGTFGPAINFEGGGTGEYALHAADMDNDGITDLVVGLGTDQLVVVHKGNGNGTFTPQPAQSAGGAVWMLVCGDVDADGKMDVSTANSFSATSSFLRGNGDGTLQAPMVFPASGHSNATDLGDLDGDGDLDWVVSCFGGQNWRVMRYGGGTFTLVTTFTSPANPACAALVDIDNDRDLDIVLFTETSDEIVLKENGVLDAATYCYGTAASCPCGNAGVKGHGCENSAATGGGLLNGSGRASVAADALALVASGMSSTAPILYFQGDAQVGGGAGSMFGDGLLCAGGTIIRLGIHFAVNGYDVYGAPAGDPSIATQGLIPAGGATRFYQGWYRDSVVFCAVDTFNLTNAVRVVWTP
jgi:hypothetical protein